MEDSKVLQTTHKHTESTTRATHNVAEKCLNVWRANKYLINKIQKWLLWCWWCSGIGVNYTQKIYNKSNNVFFSLISFSPRELFACSSIILLIHQARSVRYVYVCEQWVCAMFGIWLWEATNAIKNKIIPFEIAVFFSLHPP